MIPDGLSCRIFDESFTTNYLSLTFYFPLFWNWKYSLRCINLFVLCASFKNKNKNNKNDVLYCRVVSLCYIFCCIFPRVEFHVIFSRCIFVEIFSVNRWCYDFSTVRNDCKMFEQIESQILTCCLEQRCHQDSLKLDKLQRRSPTQSINNQNKH